MHRDAEKEPLERRLAEIRDAVAGVVRHYVAVVPIRMTEAWLLHDVQAIRIASGNPQGTVPLPLPQLATIECDPDPKATLEAALLAASELTGRRLEKRRREFPQMRARTAESIADFTPLTNLSGFVAFRQSLRDALVALQYLKPSS